jgi:hypothetical protein
MRSFVRYCFAQAAPVTLAALASGAAGRAIDADSTSAGSTRRSGTRNPPIPSEPTERGVGVLIGRLSFQPGGERRERAHLAQVDGGADLWVDEWVDTSKT